MANEPSIAEACMSKPTRTERDLLGEREVPSSAYYGVHTLRASENFPITGTPISVYPDLVNALACVKQAAALANRDLGLLDASAPERSPGLRGDPRGDAARPVRGRRDPGRRGHLDEHERQRGDREPRARAPGPRARRLRGAPPERTRQPEPEHERRLPDRAQGRGLVRDPSPHRRDGHLRDAFEAKSREFEDMLKMGRTQLQDAVPMTLGQEFSTYAVMLMEDKQRLRETVPLICEINMGATAVGTGIKSHPGTRSASAGTSPTSPTSHWSLHRISSRPRRMPAYSSRSLACSSASRSSSRRCATICDFCLRVLGGARRDQSAASAGRVEHHARQGEPGDPGGSEPDRIRSHRQRCHGKFRGGRRGNCSSTLSCRSSRTASSRA